MARLTRAGQPAKQRFTAIDVERINIVEPDGRLRMGISNWPRSLVAVRAAA